MRNVTGAFLYLPLMFMPEADSLKFRSYLSAVTTYLRQSLTLQRLSAITF